MQFFLDTAPAGNDFVGYVNAPNALEESQAEVAEVIG